MKSRNSTRRRRRGAQTSANIDSRTPCGGAANAGRRLRSFTFGSVAIKADAEARGARAVEIGEEGYESAGDSDGVALAEDVRSLEAVGRARRAVGVGLAHDPVDRRGRRIGRR
jgi:hypothetical protein